MARIDHNRDLFIAVDLQNDFCPGGALAVPDGDAVIPLINEVARKFKHQVMSQDWHPRGHTSFASSHDGCAPFESIEMPYGLQTLWPDHCIQMTEGAEFHAGIDLPGVVLIVRKGYDAQIDSYSAFFENDRTTPTGLNGFMRERGFERLFVAGLALDFCVQYTALDAATHGFETIVVTDACRAIDLGGSLEAAMTAMRDAGVTFVDAAAVN
jgi:nicotinamidase/pyrazinamidase